MKLKYLVQTDEKYLFANCLNDLGSYYGVTVSGIKYKIKNKLIDIHKIDTRLQDLNYEYTINKYGVVTVDKSVVDKLVVNKLVVDKKTVDKSTDKSVDKSVDTSMDNVLDKKVDKSLKVVAQAKPTVKSRSIKYIVNKK